MNNCLVAVRRLSAGAVVVAGLLLAGCSNDGPAFTGVDITGATYATSFDLTDHTGQRRTLADFKGQVVVLFFGFAQCPDVCPTTMTELAQVKGELGSDGDKLQGLFVTVDPERDTPDIMREYMANLTPASWLCMQTPGSSSKLPKTSRRTLKKLTAPRPPATPWIIRLGAIFLTPKGPFACTAVMAHR